MSRLEPAILEPVSIIYPIVPVSDLIPVLLAGIRQHHSREPPMCLYYLDMMVHLVVIFSIVILLPRLTACYGAQGLLPSGVATLTGEGC